MAAGQNALGYCYDKGTGVPQDAVEAYKWYVLAIAQKEPRAAVNMKALLLRLTPEQIAEGKRRADAFLAARLEQ